jgi:small subunit ribosomal protein S6
LGQQDFARTPDRRFPAGHYVQIEFTAPALKPASLQERIRLNKAIDRVLVERVGA